jgi:AraC-like DNA-binding protein
VQYLNAVFKREIGATPAAWRHEHRESATPQA